MTMLFGRKTIIIALAIVLFAGASSMYGSDKYSPKKPTRTPLNYSAWVTPIWVAPKEERDAPWYKKNPNHWTPGRDEALFLYHELAALAAIKESKA